jgi:hypothetical protein
LIFSAPFAATITDISGDGIGLDTTVKLPHDATVVIESQSNLAVGVVKYCREIAPHQFHLGVRLHHITTKRSDGGGGTTEPTPKKTRWLSLVSKLRHE